MASSRFVASVERSQPSMVNAGGHSQMAPPTPSLQGVQTSQPPPQLRPALENTLTTVLLLTPVQHTHLSG